MDERRGRSRWRTLKQRLALLRCCYTPPPAATTRHPTTTPAAPSAEEAEQPSSSSEHHQDESIPECEEMNLGAALAAERLYRAEAATDTAADESPLKVSLMRLLLEGEDEDDEGVGAAGGCCVCMGRRKGAAFIPCGHTFCRVCVRELWLNRGSCPLCNRPILEILDIF